MRSPFSVPVLALAAILFNPSALGAEEPPAPPRTLGLGLAPAVEARPPSSAAIVTGAGAKPAGYSLDLWQLVPHGSTFLTEARMAEWESWSGRQEWLMYRTGALGPPESAERVPLFAMSPLGIDIGPDGRPRMTMLGPWSREWDSFTAEEKFGIVLQEAATLAILAALLQGLD